MFKDINDSAQLSVDSRIGHRAAAQDQVGNHVKGWGSCLRLAVVLADTAVASVPPRIAVGREVRAGADQNRSSVGMGSQLMPDAEAQYHP